MNLLLLDDDDFVDARTARVTGRRCRHVRRILRKLAADDVHDLGDISTLADPSVVKALVQGRAGSHTGH